MKNRTFRHVLVASVTGAVLFPLVARAQTDLPTLPAPAPATQPAVDPAKVVITVGDSKITAGEFNAFLADLEPAQQAQVVGRPDGKRKLAEEIVKLKLLSTEAKRKKLDETARTKIMYEQLLANAITTDLAEQKGGAEQYFTEHKETFDELKARHILVAVDGSGVPGAKLTDAQAKAKVDDIKKRLDKGEDFATLAKTSSDDTSSGALGGNLGSFSRGMMVPAFEDVAFALKKNEISQPVKTQFGYHIIQVLDRTPGNFEQARQQILSRRVDALIEQLRAATKTDMDDSFFGPAPKVDAAPAAPVKK